MNLFQHLRMPLRGLFTGLPLKMNIAGLRFSYHCRLLMKKRRYERTVENEFLDQAISAFLSGSYHVRNAALTAIRRFMQHSEEMRFRFAAG